MKVGELISDTTWTPGTVVGDPPPEVSVLLPTFRRGADGLLRQVIESVVNQSFRDLELIVIDDASTDGSADIIRAAMARDGRISCLTHPRNIGLPAVSEYEAYLKARGRFIGFAFDDFIFEPNAIAALVEAARAHPGTVVHGYAELVDGAGGSRILGRDPVPYGRLALVNLIANASVLMPREAIETVGLYDPHILAARRCDWDLWRRVQRRYPWLGISVFVGRELGTARSDSLGKTYPDYLEILNEFFGGRSQQALLPANLAEREVWAIPRSSSSALAATALAVRSFFKTKAWAAPLNIAESEDIRCLIEPQGPIVGVVGALDALVSLCFDGLRDDCAARIRFIDAEAVDQLPLVLGCDAVILRSSVPAPHRRRIIDICRSADIGLYCLVDDNFVGMGFHGERAPEAIPFEDIGPTLAGFKAILATSRRLADHLRTHRIHSDVRLFGPILDRATLAKMRRVAPAQHPQSLRIGLIGGSPRRTDLEMGIYAAVRAAAGRTIVELFATEATTEESRAPPPAARYHSVPFMSSYDDFLQTWRGFGIDAWVQPEGAAASIDGESGSVLILALYLGAVPIVSGEGAFSRLGEKEGVVRADGGPEGWIRAIARVADPAVRHDLLERLERFCLDHFDPSPNASIIEAICSAAKPPGIDRQSRRLMAVIKGLLAHADEADAQLNSRAFRLAAGLHRMASMVLRSSTPKRPG